MVKTRPQIFSHLHPLGLTSCDVSDVDRLLVSKSCSQSWKRPFQEEERISSTFLTIHQVQLLKHTSFTHLPEQCNVPQCGPNTCFSVMVSRSDWRVASAPSTPLTFTTYSIIIPDPSDWREHRRLSAARVFFVSSSRVNIGQEYIFI